MRRTPAATPPSATMTKQPMSPVALTCVPPHSSMLKPGTLTTRTLSPYFSPNSAIAPAAIASCVERTSVVTGVLRQICSLTIRSMRSISSRVTGWKWTKSKRSRSGATSDPACFTCVPSTSRKRRVQQMRRRVVAARRVANLRVHLGRDDVAGRAAAPRSPARGARAADPVRMRASPSTVAEALVASLTMRPESDTWPPASR